MRDQQLEIPERRREQFRYIELARQRLIEFARAQGIRLMHVEFVVPFVEDDFNLSAWLFYGSRDDVDEYAKDGTSESLHSRFGGELANAGYPVNWLPLVDCYYASKQEVDEEYDGRYFRYVR